MKKILVSLMLLMASVCIMNAQEIVFSKFELWKSGFVKEHKILDIQFKSMVDKEVKYLHVYWYALNRVGDVIDGQVSALDHEHTNVFRKHAKIVGPLPAKKKKLSRFQPAVITNLPVTPMPAKVVIEYMDGDSWSVDITKENLKTYFPKLDWIEYTPVDN